MAEAIASNLAARLIRQLVSLATNKVIQKPEWEKLRNSLLAVGGAKGTDILVTTRRQEVVDAMRCSDPYQVQKLSKEDSWELFKYRAFTDGGVLETEAFAALGRRTVKRCGGLPLAIKALGGL
ncbi:putative disease resistance protein RGA3 [Apium graveolens]|uniref:putative disease resistance protein RGA3 n=1 Tax=Apium graveolens TaxID=4045 RepID=UPI003D797174